MDWYYLDKKWIKLGENIAVFIENEYQEELRGDRTGQRVYHCFGDHGSAIINFNKMETECGSGRCMISHEDRGISDSHMTYRLCRGSPHPHVDKNSCYALFSKKRFEIQYEILLDALRDGNARIDEEIKELKTEIKNLRRKKKAACQRSREYRCEAFCNEYDASPYDILNKYDFKRRPTTVEMNAYRAIYAKDIVIDQNVKLLD